MKKLRKGLKINTPDGEGVIYYIDESTNTVFVRIGKNDKNFDIDELYYFNDELWKEN